MDDTKYIIDNEYPPATEHPTELQPPNGQHMGHAPPPYGDVAVTVQPGPVPAGVNPRPAWDESDIKTRSIISVVISAVAVFCGCAIFCAIPALILGVLALVFLRSDPDRARGFSNSAMGLTIAASVFGLISVVISIWYYASGGYRYTNEYDYGY